MDQKTIDVLLQLNRSFYQTVAQPFAASRQSPWAGWDQVLQRVQTQFSPAQPLRMLDLGCGNGRWGKYFFEQTAHSQTTYVGVDENLSLLHAASRSLLSQAQLLVLHHLDLKTFVAQAVETQASSYDLIVLFGVWHHLPGSDQRATLLTQLARLLKPNGLLVISCWRFRRSPSLRARLVSPSEVGIGTTGLEIGDYFLDWQAGARAIRYCHDVEGTELLAQARAADLQQMEAYAADGKTGELNDYYIFSRAT